MPHVAQIWRYPIKSHGREALSSVAVTEGSTLPWDRAWAVAHEASDADGTTWAPCQNFSRGSKAPRLMAISSSFDEVTGIMTLKHPDQKDLSFDPGLEQQKFLDWAGPLVPSERAQSARLVRSKLNGLTDTDYPSISIGNLASHRAVCQKFGRDLSLARWRGNIWIDGLAPWEEFDWLGKQLKIGSAVFEICERVVRCMATTANPETGKRDADTLGTLETWDHRDFNVYAVAVSSGRINVGDPVSLA
ncbi:MAG: MOSC domain-containing protein [Paracoccaceae bacterium]